MNGKANGAEQRSEVGSRASAKVDLASGMEMEGIYN